MLIYQIRKPKSVFVNIQGGSYEFEILNVCEFNSTRKRMSTVVRTPEGQIKLYCKGADTVILERLSKNQPFVDKTMVHLEVCDSSFHCRFMHYLLNIIFRTMLQKAYELCVWPIVISLKLNIANGPQSMTKLQQRSMGEVRHSTKPRKSSKRICSCWVRQPSRTNSRREFRIPFTHCRWRVSRSGSWLATAKKRRSILDCPAAWSRSRWIWWSWTRKVHWERKNLYRSA